MARAISNGTTRLESSAFTAHSPSLYHCNDTIIRGAQSCQRHEQDGRDRTVAICDTNRPGQILFKSLSESDLLAALNTLFKRTGPSGRGGLTPATFVCPTHSGQSAGATTYQYKESEVELPPAEVG